MGSTGAPWNIPFVEPTDIPRTYPEDSEDLALAIAAGLSAAGNPGIGSNVVQTVKTDTFTTTSTTFVTVTGMTATITPTSNTSKVLVIVQASASGSHGIYRIAGGNTASYVGNADGSRTQGLFGFDQNVANENGIVLSSNSVVFLDSPNTASPVTYELQARQTGAAVFFNRTQGDGNNAITPRGASSITLIEVAA